MGRTLKHIMLEIMVDRANEKWVFVASQILSTLHTLVDIRPPKWKFWESRKLPWFQFEVVAIGGVIRFYILTQAEYKNFIEAQFYAHYPDIEIREVEDPLTGMTLRTAHAKLAHYSLDEIKLYTNLKDRTEKDTVDPLSSITSVLAKTPKDAVALFHVDFSPLPDEKWRTKSKLQILGSHFIPDFLKRPLLAGSFFLQLILFPFRILSTFIGFLVRGSWERHDEHDAHNEKWENISTKKDMFGYSVAIRVGKTLSDRPTDATFLRELGGSLHIFSNPNGNRFLLQPLAVTKREDWYVIPKKQWILSVHELAGMVHLPTIYVKTPGINWIMTRKFEPPHNLPTVMNDMTPIGVANFRGGEQSFGIKPIDRARHIYIIGKTGMGKSTLLENMLYSDILSGRGIGLIDPHGDLADTILANIPKSRTNDIVLFDPSDSNFPIAFNMLENSRPELTPIVASGLVSIFKKMFADSWGPRLEYILRNTILTLLMVPDTTLISIPLILTHEAYRKKVVSKITDPILVQFWTQEFEKMAPAQMSEAVNPILNKVGQFLSSPLLRNILGQPRNPFSLRWIMDNGKIFIVNLSKWKIGEDASALLGAMMVTKFQIEAMTRADIPENERRDFGLYVDEFQNFATDSFATILSEARKYKLTLTMANQYIAQMPETVQTAVFWNVGTLVSFQVWHHDALVLADVFWGEDVILPNDLTNLRKYDIYTKLLIDGMPSPVFSATTFAPLHQRMEVPEQQSRDVLLRISREKYTKKREFVEKKIAEYATKITEEEKKYQKDQMAYKEKIKEEKKKKSDEEREKQTKK